MSVSDDAPWLWLIGGPNGAGKTTLAFDVLGATLGTDVFLNSDIIAQSLAPLAPGSASMAAGRELLRRLGILTQVRQSFAVETTLSSRSYLSTISRLKVQGWNCGLLFVWLDSAELSLSRVAQRVASGGHDIPEADIRRRHGRIRGNFADYANACDRVLVFDNSGATAILIAEMDCGRLTPHLEGHELTRLLMP